MVKIAAIRIRGKINVRYDLESNLSLAGLKRKNSCIIVEANPVNMGMLKRAKDFITYGEISEETLKKLKEKKKPSKEKENKLIYNLPNPKKGFRAIKRGFNQGGDLGYRGDKINELLGRIIENIE